MKRWDEITNIVILCDYKTSKIQVQQSSATYLKMVAKGWDRDPDLENDDDIAQPQIGSRTMEIMVASSELRDRSCRCGIWGGPFTIISYGFFSSVCRI